MSSATINRMKRSILKGIAASSGEATDKEKFGINKLAKVFTDIKIWYNSIKVIKKPQFEGVQKGEQWKVW